MREIIEDLDRKNKRAQNQTKEFLRLKKQARDKDKDMIKMKEELKLQKATIDEYKIKIEELAKKQAFNNLGFNSR